MPFAAVGLRWTSLNYRDLIASEAMDARESTWAKLTP